MTVPNVGLDDLLTTQECARWLRMSPRRLLANVRAGAIPAAQINARVLRFHPRTILARCHRHADEFASAAERE
jgi:hypothetical protein